MKRLTALFFALVTFAFGQSLNIASTSMLAGSTTQAYSMMLLANGGTPPYTWTFTGLPAGVTGATNGAVSGTPTATGTFSVTATVTDSATPTHATANATYSVVVQGQWGPYDTPAAVTVCQVDTTKTPPAIVNDTALSAPRCFAVPEAVSEAIVRFMLTQSSGLNSNGTPAYTYASWWDYLIKSYVAGNIMPLLDKFPPTSVAQAQAAADAANAALQAAKAAAAGVTTGQ